ncbi:phage major capsid protein [Hwanghaeella sp.]|uniref:phage major capsid protein n=1 Tax=Hwanghaeella sp. TaxID=2605943 RepID=UPI003CCBD1A4
MPDDKKTAEELAAEVKKDFEKSIDTTKEIAEEALATAKKTGENTDALKEKADEALLKMNSLMEQVATLEQEVAKGAKDNDDGTQKSLGQQFIDDERVKEFLASTDKRGKASLEVKATITSATTDTAGAMGVLVQTQRVPGIVELPQRRMTVRDLLSPGQTDSNAIEYVRETGFTNNAAMVAEGAAKPESDIKADLVTRAVRTVAHTMKASRQILDDASQLRSLIDQRLTYGLDYVEETQLLSGDGTGQNLHGIIPQATAYSAPITLASPTSIDQMRLAMLQALLAEYPATGHVMNPIDWAWVETLKDTTGRYIIGNPQGTTAPRLWNLPVVTTQAMAVDKFLTGAFKQGAQVFDRWLSRVEIATENQDDFIKNLITALCEERLVLAVYRPEGFIYGDFGRVA